MPTWAGGTEEIVCKECGANHLVGYRDYPARDSGKEHCLACGGVLIEWNSSRDYTVLQLLKPKGGK